MSVFRNAENTAHDAVYGLVALQLNGRRRCAIGAAAIVGHLGRAGIVHLDIRFAVHVCTSRRIFENPSIHKKQPRKKKKKERQTISKDSFIA